LETKDILDGKNILVVDDEQDILDTLSDLLSMCHVDTASSFDMAWQKLGTGYYDIAILDIMGVNGYRLLSLAGERNITAIMLTSHALNPENAEKSFEQGAALYLPKDEMINITHHLRDVLEAKEEGKSTWWRWVERLGTFFDTRFSPDWKSDREEFWEKLQYLSRR
jgi:CheY-like chemotaxis protein